MPAADARREPDRTDDPRRVDAREPSTDTGLIRGAGPANRTSLSWQRTSAAAALVAMFAAFTAFRLGEPGVAIAASVVAVVGLLLGAATPRASRHRPEDRHLYAFIVRGAVVLAMTGMLGVALAVYALVDG